MRGHLIKRQTIEDFIRKNATSRSAFNHWLSIIRYADRGIPQDIISTFMSADILGKNSQRVVFNIGGNNFRMICKYIFGRSKIHLFVCWIGSHAEYDELCRDNLQYTINIY